VRILDIGGMIWESDERCKTIDQALAAAEQALAEWIGENLSAPASASSLQPVYTSQAPDL